MTESCRVYVVAPLCSAWVAFVRAECAEAACVIGLMAMGTCQCDLKAARYVGGFPLHGRKLLGWTFETRGCSTKSE